MVRHSSFWHIYHKRYQTVKVSLNDLLVGHVLVKGVLHENVVGLILRVEIFMVVRQWQNQKNIDSTKMNSVFYSLKMKLQLCERRLGDWWNSYTQTVYMVILIFLAVRPSLSILNHQKPLWHVQPKLKVICKPLESPNLNLNTLWCTYHNTHMLCFMWHISANASHLMT